MPCEQLFSAVPMPLQKNNAGRFSTEADYHEGREFAGMAFSQHSIVGHTFVDCTFSSSHFREMAATGTIFRSCVFKTCEFVLVKLHNATLSDVAFESCKIMGINFSECSPAGFSSAFRHCTISNVVFDGLALKRTKIIGCRLTDCDLLSCDFREADFSETEFQRVAVNNCNLEKADLRTARGYAIDPAANKVRGARFSLPEAQSFLPFLGIRIDA
jgi:fluoroquinolone resistance protein